jgi:hypothetical protein
VNFYEKSLSRKPTHTNMLPFLSDKLSFITPIAAKRTSAVPNNTAARDVLLGEIALTETEIKPTKKFDPDEGSLYRLAYRINF